MHIANLTPSPPAESLAEAEAEAQAPAARGDTAAGAAGRRGGGPELLGDPWLGGSRFVGLGCGLWSSENRWLEGSLFVC